MNSTFCCTSFTFYLFSHEGSSQVHILHLNQTWQVTQAQGIKLSFSVQDDQLIILKCHANICVLAEIQTSLNKMLSLMLRVHSAGTAWETKNILSNQIPFCRSDKQLPRFF